MSQPIKTWSTVIGHVAMVTILVVYLAFSIGWIGKVPYTALGMLTSVMMAFHGWERKSYPLMLLNTCWFTISAIGVWRG